MNAPTKDTDVSAIELNIATEMQKEVTRLDALIGNTLANLHATNQDIVLLQEEIDDFLEEYLQEVGPFLDELDATNYVIRSLEGKVSAQNPEISQRSTLLKPVVVTNSTVPGNLVIHEEAKKLYRKLVKLCHPDADTTAQEREKFFSLLTQAYKQNDLKTLIQIEQMFAELTEFYNEPIEEKLYRLSQKYDAVLQTYKQACYKKKELETSPAYQLKCKVLWEKMRGNNHIDAIKQHLRKKIYERNKMLLRKQQDKILAGTLLDPVHG